MAYNTTRKLTTFHLFSGAGGGILADLLLGHIPIGACEIEKYPRDVLLARQRDGILPTFPIWDDVCSLDGTPWRGSVDVLCGGFPCQDISSAGNGAGITGERSGLWKEYARLIDEMRPKLVFAENSPLLRTRGLGTVLKDLADLGYDARWCVLGAGDVGAPHQRKRMWVMAYPNGSGGNQDSSNSELWSGGIEQSSSDTRTSNSTEIEEGWWHTDPAEMAYTTSELREQTRLGCRTTEEQPTHGVSSEASGGSASKGAQTFEPIVGRVVDGVANRVDRLKAIGNGQVPQCAAVAFNILSEGLI